jgi:Tol biopolymer transport system component
VVLPNASFQLARWRAGLAGVVLAAVLISMTWTSDADGAFPGRDGRIAIVSSWLGCGGDQTNVATIRPDGTDLRTLTRCDEWWGSAEWLADGRRLLAVRQRVPWIMAADGTHRRRVTLHPEAYDVSVSPDGRHVTYTLPPRSQGMLADAEIWRAQLDGRGQRHIGDGEMPRWSPDGRHIAFIRASGVSVMDASTGKHVRVLVPDLTAHSLDWPPDSRRLAITVFNQYSQVLTISANGSRPTRRVLPRRRQVGDLRLLYGVVWSPDGKRFAFARPDFDGENVNYSIWTMTTRGTHVKRIRSSGLIDTEGNSAPSLSWGPRR